MQPHNTTNDIPYGYCQCGCGQKTSIAPHNRAARGWIKGEPLRFLPGHNMLQEPMPASPNPSGLCMCGCGEKTQLAPQTDRIKGWVRGEPMRYLPQHGATNATPEQAFWAYVTPGDPNECWVWHGTSERNGYGRARYRGKRYSAHRLSWILHHGTIGKGLWVLHKCDNPACVNPHHLLLGTSKDNTDDMTRKGRDGGRFKPGHPYRKHV